MKPQLILLGAPGSGKGTQSARLVSDFGYSHVSTGDLLRGEIAKGSELGQRVKAIMDSGALVDDATVLELLNANCELGTSSYIFDGFPRNLDQARALDDVVLKGANSKAIYFDIDLEVLVNRITNRRIAPKSGRIYNLLTNPPKVSGKCDESGEDLIHRADDNEETVRNRINVFKDAIDPVIDYYSKKGVLHKVDASAGFDEIFASLSKIIND
jgi:adenylate kinase